MLSDQEAFPSAYRRMFSSNTSTMAGKLLRAFIRAPLPARQSMRLTHIARRLADVRHFAL
jgi:hypothetical protein